MTDSLPAVPSLMPGAPAAPAPTSNAATYERSVLSREATSLAGLMVDGFYMLFLLKNRYAPRSAEELRARIKAFFAQVDRGARRLQAGGLELSADDIHLAKYAYCALVDETVLTSQSAIRDEWARRPLQLELFGDQLAGENFFARLEALRREGAPRVQALEVFHMSLLLGFQGKYLIEDGSEQLGYLVHRLGDEIAALKDHKGRRAGFAPHWQAPDAIRHRLRGQAPLWVVGSLFALAGLVAFIGLRAALERQSAADLSGYAQVIQLPAPAAHITITLP